ncbi:MAG: thiamine/thiamine pyrophosphate ABC transporter permease ThiP [Pseudomonadota bacterium]
MAPGAQPVSARPGIAAATCVAAVVLVAMAAVIWRAEALTAFGAAEWQAVRFTLAQALVSALLSVALAVPVARALARRRVPGRAVLVTLLGAPFILPVIVAVMGLLSIFGRNGWLNSLLEAVGLPTMSIYGAHGVVLAHVFFNMPLATRLILQAWQAIPAEQFRLVGQLGLGPWTVFRSLEWPLLRQVVPGAFALIFVICLTSFAVALTLGGGPRATTIELAIYQAFRFDFDLGRAALLSLLQILVAGSAALLAFWILPPLAVQRGMDRPAQRWDGRRAGTRAVDTFWIAFGAAFLLLPLLSVLLSGVGALTQLPASTWRAAMVSLGVAGLSTALLVALALPLAGWLALGRSGALEGVSLLGLVASPLMIGTGWFLLINPVMDPRLLALPVTALVNALMALPFAVRILVPPLRQSLTDYGRLSVGLGLRGFAAWRIVLLPRVRPALGFAAGLGAALSVGDLGVVTLFADPDLATLPLQMYRMMGRYQTEAAAGAAVLLLGMALLLFWLCDQWGRYAER